MTSASFGCVAADSGSGIVLNEVLAQSTFMIDDSMLRSRERLAESPVVSECLNRSSVQALTLESTRDEKESAIFYEIANGA